MIIKSTFKSFGIQICKSHKFKWIQIKNTKSTSSKVVLDIFYHMLMSNSF